MDRGNSWLIDYFFFNFKFKNKKSNLSCENKHVNFETVLKVPWGPYTEGRADKIMVHYGMVSFWCLLTHTTGFRVFFFILFYFMIFFFFFFFFFMLNWTIVTHIWCKGDTIFFGMGGSWISESTTEIFLWLPYFMTPFPRATNNVEETCNPQHA